MADVEVTLKRLQQNKGVIGIVVTDWEGHVVKSTLDDEHTAQYANLVMPLAVIDIDVNSRIYYFYNVWQLANDSSSPIFSVLAEKSRSVLKELDASNDLTFLRVRSKKHEIMLAPENDYLLIVVQKVDH